MKTTIFVSLVVICSVASLFNAYARSGKHLTLAVKNRKAAGVQEGIVK